MEHPFIMSKIQGGGGLDKFYISLNLIKFCIVKNWLKIDDLVNGIA